MKNFGLLMRAGVCWSRVLILKTQIIGPVLCFFVRVCVQISSSDNDYGSTASHGAPTSPLVQTGTEDSPIHVITQNQKGELSIVFFFRRTLLVDPGGFDIYYTFITQKIYCLKNTSVIDFTLLLCRFILPRTILEHSQIFDCPFSDHLAD